MASIRMIVACGAETRIAQRYDVYVDEAKKHAQFISPLIAAQFGLVVCSLPAVPFLLSIMLMYCSFSVHSAPSDWRFGSAPSCI